MTEHYILERTKLASLSWPRTKAALFNSLQSVVDSTDGDELADFKST